MKDSGVALQNDIPFKNYGEFLGYYIKLRREGDTFISYTSPDGENWKELARRTVKMGEKVYIGLAVDGNKVHNDINNLNTAKFSEVRSEGSSTAEGKLDYSKK